MKLIYSHLQKFLPTLEVNPQQLRDDLTMIGHFTNFFENIEGEIVFDLDIKVNRGDCLGYYGIAKDLSVFYNIPLLTNISPEIVNQATEVLPIKVTTENVKRILAVKFSQLQNTTSPPWLLKFTICHQIKSINLIVDLTNYVMFMYGIPSHAFDTKKSTDSLIWEMNPKYQEFTSLDGTKLTLNKDILMINNPDQPLSLSFWGGNNCAIDQNTSEIILEMAIYNPTIVRQNSRQLKSTTEAGTRLEKQLDPNLIPLAFNHLCKLILQNAGGQITSAFFDYYPQTITLPSIKFNTDKPSLISGIKIPSEFSLDCLTRLGCDIKDNQIIPPSIRPDITIEADLVEEVVRFWGYQKIPTDQPLSYKKLTDITPKEIYLIDSLKDKLTDLGYDEILSWPLVSKPIDSQSVVTTQNSINTESIYLRQSLIPSLKEQLNQHLRYKLNNSQFFEIGKIFFKEGDNYIEKNSLGIYHPNPDQLKKDLQYLNLPNNFKDSSFVEIIVDNLDKIDNYQPKVLRHSAYELTSQLVILDANIVFDSIQDSSEIIEKYTQLIGPKYLWEIVITDIYQDTTNKIYRYTFRVSYYSINDKLAKEIHLKAFNLI
mgnify:CR=1 FL=1